MEHKEKKPEVKQSSSFADKSAVIGALCEKADNYKMWHRRRKFQSSPSIVAHMLLALDSRDSQIFLHLLSRGANVDIIIGEYYRLPEWVALCCQWSSAEKEEALQALARRGAHLNPFLLAAFKGEEQALSPDALSVTDNCSNNIAHYAAANGQLALLKRLMSSYPNLVASRYRYYYPDPPLIHAAFNGKLEVVQWLLREGGAKITEKTYSGKTDGRMTALLLAAKAGHLEMVQWLLREGGAKITEKTERSVIGGYGWAEATALLLAAEAGHLEVVQWLLREGGAKITEKDYHGMTALLLAVKEGYLEMVQWLLREGGAKITEKDYHGMTALLLAVKEGYLEVVQWLLREGGAKITEKDYHGMTALLLAAKEGHLEVVQWLLREGGAKIIEKTESGINVLDAAILYPHAKIDRHANIVDWLVADCGADPLRASFIVGGYDSKARKQKAKELEALSYGYHAKQQLPLHKRVLHASLPNFPKELRGIIAEYVGIDDKEKRGLRQQTLIRNESLVKELKTYLASWNPFPLTSKRLARELMAEISSQHPCNELTIYDSVFAFLGKHRQEITDIDLLNILEKILRETHYFELPNQQSADKSKLDESKQGGSSNSNGVNTPSQQLSLSSREIADILNHNYKELGVLDKPNWMAGERSAYTSVNSKEQAELLVRLLQEHFSEHFNFTIEKVLRATSSAIAAVTSYNLHVNAKIKVSQQSTAEQSSSSSVPLKESKRESKKHSSTTSALSISASESLLNDLCREARVGSIDTLFALTDQLYRNKQPNHFYINPLLAALTSKDAIAFKFLLTLVPEQILQGYSSKLEGEIISTTHWQEKERQSALQAWEARVLFWAPEKQDNKSEHPPSLSASSLTKQASLPATTRGAINFLPPPRGKVNKGTDDQEKEKLLKEVEPFMGDSQQGGLKFPGNGDGN